MCAITVFSLLSLVTTCFHLSFIVASESETSTTKFHQLHLNSEVLQAVEVQMSYLLEAASTEDNIVSSNEESQKELWRSDAINEETIQKVNETFSLNTKHDCSDGEGGRISISRGEIGIFITHFPQNASGRSSYGYVLDNDDTPGVIHAVVGAVDDFLYTCNELINLAIEEKKLRI